MTRHTETNIEQLQERVDYLDGHLVDLEEERDQLQKHIEQLEQLCNDLFDHVCAEQLGARVNMAQFVELSERMGDLGLLEVDE